MKRKKGGDKRAQTDTDTDAESTQSRHKKGQMKQHEEIYDKSKNSFKDKQKKERLWEQLAGTRNWFETQHTRYGKLTQTNSGQAAEKNTERQT